MLAGDPEELHPVHFRHADVRDEEVEALLGKPLGGAATLTLQKDLRVRQLAQGTRVDLEYALFVVHYKDACLRHVVSPGCLLRLPWTALS